ncbi:MATE family efflux transporter [Diplocloster agilis]|uniref:Multidrug export protein MepA n=1 Tax=Diplocloster agilis TaxID=2850323 RepID=A0A949K8R0_9FIRM|nr:MATE family efflux transporter [Diplocloster agilis]MBU9738502.1 MATE family efflux transporter [Diplocloster agilis]
MAVTVEKEAIFEREPIPRAVAALSVPTVISSLVTVIYSMADTYFVGLLNAPVQTAAVTLAAPVLLAFNAVNNLFGVGSSSMMSRSLGRKDMETVRLSSAFGFYGALICGILFSLLCTVFRPGLLGILGADVETISATSAYLDWTVTIGAVPAILNVVMAYMIRSEGASVNASIGTMSGCLLNIALDPVFVLPWGFNMGAEGAGLATCISNCFALIYFLVYLWIKRGKSCVNISPRSFKLRRNVVLGVCTVGIPAAIQNLLNVIGSTVLNNLAAPFGAAVLAAMGICSKINMVPMYLAMGLAQGVMPLISYNFASGNTKRMKAAMGFTMKIAESLLIVSAAVMFFGSNPLVRFFIEDADTVAFGSLFLKGFCLAQPFLAIDFLCVSTFQAVGMGKESLAFAIMRKPVLEIPFMYLLNFLFPLYGLPFAQALTEVFMSALAGAVMIRFLRRLSHGGGPGRGPSICTDKPAA